MYKQEVLHMQTHNGRMSNGLTPYEMGWLEGHWTVEDLQIHKTTAELALQTCETVFQEEYENANDLPPEYAAIEREVLRGCIERERRDLQQLIDLRH